MELLARNIEVFKQYLDAGADANAMGGLFEWTLLHEAANVSRKEIVELLIAEGADVNARAFDGETPLDVAIHPINSFLTQSVKNYRPPPQIRRQNKNLKHKANETPTTLTVAAVSLLG